MGQTGVGMSPPGAARWNSKCEGGTWTPYTPPFWRRLLGGGRFEQAPWVRLYIESVATCVLCRPQRAPVRENGVQTRYGYSGCWFVRGVRIANNARSPRACGAEPHRRLARLDGGPLLSPRPPRRAAGAAANAYPDGHRRRPVRPGLRLAARAYLRPGRRHRARRRIGLEFWPAGRGGGAVPRRPTVGFAILRGATAQGVAAAPTFDVHFGERLGS